MSRYRGPKLKIVRRLDRDDTLRGLTQKQSTRRTTAGQHGKKRRLKEVPNLKAQAGSGTIKSQGPKKQPQYRIRLQEKQKLRFNYGITDSQLIKYVKHSKKSKVPTGERLLQFLEMRLDNIVFRLGLTPTIPAARQLITHGHVLVNNKRVTIPSYQSQSKDVISIARKEQTRELVSRNLLTNYQPPNHLAVNREKLVGLVKGVVSRNNVQLKIKELLVVEYYSRQV